MGTYEKTRPDSATGDGTAGTSGAAELRLENRDKVAVFYNVGASSDDIKIEGSTDGSSWRELNETVASGSVTTGGDVVGTFDCAYEHIRAYAGSSFSDANVTTIEVTAKG